VLARLPAQGMPRAQLAAEVLGDSHGLDSGRPVAAIVLRACTQEPGPGAAASMQGAEESSRERWARLGVTVNELAAPALCLNLPLVDAGTSDPALPHLIAAGEPVHLSLRRLLRNPPRWNVAQRAVFVCENPNIAAIAADRLGAACAPLVCTDGMPAAAQQTLLAQLAAAGARLLYHGDFDWAGLVIANFVMREFGAEPWRFGVSDYGTAAVRHGFALRGTPVAASWDDGLADAMSERGVAVHEESVAVTLLLDLAAGQFGASR
jgi:uncharacterized protein (TIGR02679 family)